MTEETHLTDPVLQKLIVTCTTDGCINSGIAIEVTTIQHAQVSCGPCRAVLVDDVPELEELEELEG